MAIKYRSIHVTAGYDPDCIDSRDMSAISHAIAIEVANDIFRRMFDEIGDEITRIDVTERQITLHVYDWRPPEALVNFVSALNPGFSVLVVDDGAASPNEDEEWDREVFVRQWAIE